MDTHRVHVFKILLLSALLVGCQLPTQADINRLQALASALGVPDIRYKYTDYVLPKGVAIDPLTPLNNGGKIQSCSILPDISNTGLHFDSSNCQISGVPMLPGGLDQFIVTASNDLGSSRAVIRFTFTNPSPPQSAGDPTVTIVGGYGDSDPLHPTIVPPGTKMSSLTLDQGAYVVIQDLVEIDTIMIKGDSTLVVNAPNTFAYVGVDYGTLMNTNGTLNVRVTGMFSVSTNGKVFANGRSGSQTCDGSQNGGNITITANYFENDGAISANSLSPDPNMCGASGGNIVLSSADIFLVGHVEAFGTNGRIGTLAINVIDLFKN